MELKSANQSFTVKQAVLEGTNQTEGLTGNAETNGSMPTTALTLFALLVAMTASMAAMATTLSTKALAMTNFMENKMTTSSGRNWDDELYGGYGNDNLKEGMVMTA